MKLDEIDTIGSFGCLECEDCGGYYELQPKESPEDFDKCQCGGKLKYIQSMPQINKSDNLDDNNKDHQRSLINLNKKRNLILIILIAIGIIAIPILIYSMPALTQSPIKYTLLGSYDVDNLTPLGETVTIPKGTKNIKIDYNISYKTVSTGTNSISVDAYDTDIGKTVPSGVQNIIDDRGFTISKGKNINGTYYFNNTQIKSLALEGNGIQGTVKIYTSQ